jgi:hypothetical protein
VDRSSMPTWCRNSAASEIPYGVASTCVPGNARRARLRSCGDEFGEVLHEGGCEVVPREHLERGGHHESGCLRKPFEEREDARADIAPGQSATDRRGARQEVEVIGLGVGESHRTRDSREDLARWPRETPHRTPHGSTTRRGWLSESGAPLHRRPPAVGSVDGGSLCDHDLAVGFAVLDVGHRVGGVCEWEGSVEHGVQDLLVVERGQMCDGCRRLA